MMFPHICTFSSSRSSVPTTLRPRTLIPKPIQFVLFYIFGMIAIVFFLSIVNGFYSFLCSQDSTVLMIQYIVIRGSIELAIIRFLCFCVNRDVNKQVKLA
ncbi:hypothetical protein A1F94_004200 [Pyrenophora tritici-repentis]|nr:hypothetical protein A1F94_004200 [Pyrenophora tritici-repentis]